MKELKDWFELTERYTMFLDWKTQYCENDYTTQVQLLNLVPLFTTLWTAAQQASLSITNSWSLLKLISIESVMPSSHLIFCRPLLLLPSIFPNIRVFSGESVLHIWQKTLITALFSMAPKMETSASIYQKNGKKW